MNPVKLNTCSLTAMHLFLEWGRRPDLAEFFRHFTPYFEWSRDQQFLAYFQTNSLEIVYGTEVVGLVHIGQVNITAKTLQVSLLIDHPLHKEIMDQAYKQVGDYVFNEKDFNKIEAKLLPHRVKLLERLKSYGFKTEGKLRQSCKLNNEFQDELVIGLLKEDRIK